MSEGHWVRSFPPLVDENCRVLVLGTLPGAASLAAGEYYAHPRNAFWPILAALLGRDAGDPYNERCRWLVSSGVALWDVVDACRRRGSADAAMTDAAPNDVAGLLNGHPGITAVFFNGQTAQRLFERTQRPRLARPGLFMLGLPSTSPAYVLPFEEKLSAWRALADPL